MHCMPQTAPRIGKCCSDPRLDLFVNGEDKRQSNPVHMAAWLSNGARELHLGYSRSIMFEFY
jgi:hypothetical protein